MCADFNDPGVMELMNSEVPVVTIDYLHHNCTAVSSNNIQGMEDLVRYIYSQGHRRIATSTDSRMVRQLPKTG